MRRTESEAKADLDALVDFICETPARTVTGAAVKLWVAVDMVIALDGDAYDVSTSAMLAAFEALRPLAGIDFPPFKEPELEDGEPAAGRLKTLARAARRAHPQLLSELRGTL